MDQKYCNMPMYINVTLKTSYLQYFSKVCKCFYLLSIHLIPTLFSFHCTCKIFKCIHLKRKDSSPNNCETNISACSFSKGMQALGNIFLSPIALDSITILYILSERMRILQHNAEQL